MNGKKDSQQFFNQLKGKKKKRKKERKKRKEKNRKKSVDVVRKKEVR